MNFTTLKDLSKIIISLKIQPSSTVMIHSSLLKFGIIENGVEGFFNCILESLHGDPTILMPAFSFSFSDTGYWSARRTKSEMGALTEYFRKLNGVVRTIHPFHSVSAYGKHAKDFIGCNSSSSFGEGSPFELMVQLNAYNLSLGTEFIGGATYLHHTEEICHVPYRYYKKFHGKIYDIKDKMINNVFKMYVRKTNDIYEYENNWDIVFKDLYKKNCFYIDYLNGAKIILSSINKTHNIFKKFIILDPYYPAVRVDKKNN